MHGVKELCGCERGFLNAFMLIFAVEEYAHG